MTRRTPPRGPTPLAALTPLACMALLITATVPALAQSFSRPDLRVIRADAVIEPIGPLALGADLSLESRNHLPAAAARDMRSAFELRLFRIDGPDADPKPWKADLDHCDIFLTMVFKHLRLRGDRVDIGPLRDEHWLEKTAGGFLTQGHWLLVIEQDSMPDAASEKDHWEVFRLASARRAEYFKQGARIEIDARATGGQPVPGPDEDTRVKAALDLVARTVRLSLNCYQTRPVSLATNAAAQVELAACPAPAEALRGG